MKLLVILVGLLIGIMLGPVFGAEPAPQPATTEVLELRKALLESRMQIWRRSNHEVRSATMKAYLDNNRSSEMT
jgi:hypothetical protein